MTSWSDQTIRMSSRAEVQIAPDGDVHLTWVEGSVSLTVILSGDEARDLMEVIDRKRAEHRASVAST